MSSFTNNYNNILNVNTLRDAQKKLSHALSDLEILRAYEVTNIPEAEGVPKNVAKVVNGENEKHFDLIKSLHIDPSYYREGKEIQEALFPGITENDCLCVPRIKVSPLSRKKFKAGLPFRDEVAEKKSEPVMTAALKMSLELYGFKHKDVIVIPINDRSRFIVQAKSILPFVAVTRLIKTVSLYQAKAKIIDSKPTYAENLRLRPRELECIRWMAAGKSLEDIAELTNLPYRTVRYHLEKARNRYGYATNIQLVVRVAEDYGLDPLY